MGNKSTVIHCNRGLAHQVELAQQLKAGFNAKGLPCSISNKANTPADTHVVLGPWFALDEWRYANTLMIDRAYWGDPDCVSIHWLKDGEKVFLRDMPKRAHPRLKKPKTGNRRIYLCDFRQQPEGHYDTVRYHPAEKKPQGSLKDALKAHDVAIGRRSTALVDAVIHGLRVETDDLHSPVYGITDRRRWINDLSWHNWSRAEILSGEFLDGIGYNGKTHLSAGDAGRSENPVPDTVI